MTSSRIAFIVNPHSGNGSTRSKWPVIQALAKDRLGSFRCYMTQGVGDAKQIARNAIVNGAELVVCVGGDGTLNEVINGIMSHEESVRSGLVVGVVPNGTGCDFIKTVSIPTDIHQAIDLIAARSIRSIDLGNLVFQDFNGRNSSRYFHNVASFGLGGEVAHRVNKTTKPFGPFISFLWSTLICIFQYGKKKIRFKVDDGIEQEFNVWNVAVANGQFHGAGMWIAPNASVDDGLFHITVIGDLTLPEVFSSLPKLYNGKVNDIDKVISLTGKKIEALTYHRALLEVDGEQPGMLPTVINVVPGALKIISKTKELV